MKLRQGIDIVEVPRLKQVMQRNADFLHDIFTERERSYCQSGRYPYIHFAGRFAAKESFIKALGSGFRGAGICHLFQEIEIIPASSGRPMIFVSGWAEEYARKRRIRQWDVSISHASHYAIAAVILVGD
jgi:holo-[acyl-carrier protein] synthase